MADTISTESIKDDDLLRQAIESVGAPEGRPEQRPGAGGTPSAEVLPPHEQTAQRLVTDEDVKEALVTLDKYKQGKANLERRIIEDERWYQLRHWEFLRNQNVDTKHPQPQPTSAWLFNSISNKHADAMDNYPQANVLPRERGDEQDAKTLSSILPVIMERGNFEDVYSHCWWEKLKHGTGVYGVFWDSTLQNGVGDISVQEIDLLNIFWEPGITDIQKSRNVFVVTLADADLLVDQYPELDGHLNKSAASAVAQYKYDDTVDTTNKIPVVDWYYKVRMDGGKTVLHYAKIISGVLVFASQNEDAYRENGWYDHGMYPFVFDTLFPEKGTPVGFGYVSICKDPQLYIDKLSANIMESSMIGSKVRFLVSEDTNLNEDELLDWNQPVVHVGGRLDDAKIQ